VASARRWRSWLDLQCYPAECGVGTPSSHVPDELAFCAYVVAEGGPVAAYLGVPLVDEDGHVLGALSVFDRRPREWDARLLAVHGRVLEEVDDHRHPCHRAAAHRVADGSPKPGRPAGSTGRLSLRTLTGLPRRSAGHPFGRHADDPVVVPGGRPG
jgi:hypothetical protein